MDNKSKYKYLVNIMTYLNIWSGFPAVWSAGNRLLQEHVAIFTAVGREHYADVYIYMSTNVWIGGGPSKLFYPFIL